MRAPERATLQPHATINNAVHPAVTGYDIPKRPCPTDTETTTFAARLDTLPGFSFWRWSVSGACRSGQAVAGRLSLRMTTSWYAVRVCCEADHHGGQGWRWPKAPRCRIVLCAFATASPPPAPAGGGVAGEWVQEVKAERTEEQRSFPRVLVAVSLAAGYPLARRRGFLFRLAVSGRTP